MCDICREWEAKIASVRRLLRAGLDDLTTERLEALIREYEQKLLAVDCPDKRKPPTS